MIISDGFTVIISAIGAVAFLFFMDHLFRLQEARVEAIAEDSDPNEQPNELPSLTDLSEESDDPNVAA